MTRETKYIAFEKDNLDNHSVPLGVSEADEHITYRDNGWDDLLTVERFAKEYSK